MLRRLFVLAFIVIAALGRTMYAQGEALDAAAANGWTVVDMKQDWKEVFPPANTIGAGRETKP
jgi:hypothetical protein